ncbi:hypothetical protein E6Q11_06230 [Candidatus Dojkabacteria bacterium]|uniref:Uncharacterized protein n=1 Tax=Candidatus Dojkabacteria bacterium TaxID=2099670 RepID=A0A5C7J3C2_9BACT|nr:MAG: hypothetical protein E6Q11_06230 [Candidatus Dojkabacteria bacterium]
MLYERVVELKVGDTEITGLDIAFEIEKDESPEPNPCHIEIYNLGPENRSVLSKYRYVPVLLKAGYKGQVGVLFQGDMMRCVHMKEGPTWKTILASGDGVMAMQTKRLDKNYAKGTPIKTVIEDLAKQLGLPLGSPLEHIKELSESLSKGFAASGNPMKDLGRVLSGKKLKLSVQNQSLQLRMDTEPLQKEAIVLRDETGLIASPEIGSDGEIVVKSLLMAEFLPGRKVFLDSAIFKGFAIIQSAHFVGSTFGQDWEAELTCSAASMGI